MKNLSLYIHIPFCVSKCHYCDFLSAPCDENTRQAYIDALCLEIEQRAEEQQGKNVDTIFFGGGTPSLLLGEQIEQIMTAIRKNFEVSEEAEISLEMNPGTVKRNKLEIYKKLGINRLSIGLQSANNEELKVLGRIHTWESFLETWNMVRQAGFSNVNIDLMSALPGQTLESYESTLKKVLALKPEHISAYSLIVEEGTLFYEWYREQMEDTDQNKTKKTVASEKENKEKPCNGKAENFSNRKLPDEATDRKMYERTKKLLEEYGYHRYEISNYALEGYECKHNIGYWKRKEYLGLGLGAASLLFETSKDELRRNEEDTKSIDKEMVKNVRCSNVSDLETYLKIAWDEEEIEPVLERRSAEGNTINNIKGGVEQEIGKKKKGIQGRKQWIEESTEVSTQEQMEEFMFLGLRMMEGVSSAEFEQQFGKSLQEIYGTSLKKLMEQKLLEYKEETERYALTLKGIDVSNQVFVEFIDCL